MPWSASKFYVYLLPWLSSSRSVARRNAMRKKIDSRIRVLAENCVKTGERCMFVIVGDKGRDQVVNLHYMLRCVPSLGCSKPPLFPSGRPSS